MTLKKRSVGGGGGGRKSRNIKNIEYILAFFVCFNFFSSPHATFIENLCKS